MKKTTGEKKVGFYLVIAAALLSLVSLLVYRTVLSQLGMVYGLSVIPAIVVVMVMAGVKIAGAKELINWAAPVNAVVTALTAIMRAAALCWMHLVTWYLACISSARLKSYIVYAVIVVIAVILKCKWQALQEL